jgi:sec-independent protein translocase protein TatC
MIYKYYLEIKNRFFLVILSWISLSLVGYFYKDILLFLFVKPCLINKFNLTVSYFIYTNVTSNYSSYLQIITFVSNHVFFIYFFYHIFMFIFLGLYKTEYKCFKLVLKLELFFIIFSLNFINYFLLPVSLNFFLSFQGLNFYFEAKICEYLNFYLFLYFIFILISQICIFLIIFLDFTVKKNFKKLKELRKFFYISFIFFATIITPPDFISQLLLSFFAVCSYEILVFYYIFKYQKKI